MGSLKNGHVFANMLSFPRLGLMGAMPPKPCLDCQRGDGGGRMVGRRQHRWRWQEKVFALAVVVVFGEKNAAFVLVVAKLELFFFFF